MLVLFLRLSQFELYFKPLIKYYFKPLHARLAGQDSGIGGVIQVNCTHILACSHPNIRKKANTSQGLFANYLKFFEILRMEYTLIQANQLKYYLKGVRAELLYWSR